MMPRQVLFEKTLQQALATEQDSPLAIRIFLRRTQMSLVKHKVQLQAESILRLFEIEALAWNFYYYEIKVSRNLQITKYPGG